MFFRNNLTTVLSRRCGLTIEKAFMAAGLLLFFFSRVSHAADYIYTTETGAVTITQYVGPDGDVTIPDEIDGVPVRTIAEKTFQFRVGLTTIAIPNSVTSIGNLAFFECQNLISVTIGSGVTNIGGSPFYDCVSLREILVNPINPSFGSVDGVLCNNSRSLLIQCPGGKAGNYTIPNTVTNIRYAAFDSCVGLTSVTIPSSVTTIGDGAFGSCRNLLGVYFTGSAPSAGQSVFLFANNNATVYYLPGTTGWGITFADRPTILWTPLVDTADASFGVQSNRFGFSIKGSANLVILVEASANLTIPAWIPVGTNTLADGSSYFSDPEWGNYPTRIYRLRSP